MRTNKLVVEYDYDFDVLAIRTSSRSYKLAWQLNQEFRVTLCRDPDIRFDFTNDSHLFIVNYKYETDYTIMRLIRNRALEFTNISKPFLIPELKDYDYLLQITGEVRPWEALELENKVKLLSGVEMTQILDVNTLKSKDNLLF